MAEERVQRRLAAILAADMVGYSRLMGADERGTIARQKTHREELIDRKISQNDGRIVKTMGDGLLVEFSSVVDAVQCAVDIQQGMADREADVPEDRRIHYRVGINLGDIIVDGDDILGDGVNIASRLEGLAEPGGICISAKVFEEVGDKLDVGFEDLGEQQVKNIAKPVRAYRLTMSNVEPVVDVSAPVAGFGDRPAVAVLPFENLSGDTEQEYFVDGLTEDIITALSQWRSFPVIARNSTFAYKGKSPDVREAGRQLGARYVLEGSVRRGGDRIRVTAQLIDAETGHHVWAERYDRDLHDIFALQDELTQGIAAVVVPELERVDHKRLIAVTPQQLDAYDCVLQGLACLNAVNERDNIRAEEMFRRAIALDPNYGRAYAALAFAQHRAVRFEYASLTEQTVPNALENARRAVRLDGSDYLAHWVLAGLSYWIGELKTGLVEAARSVELNPSNGHGYNMVGWMLTVLGRPEEAFPHFERAQALCPNDPRLNIILTWTALANYTAKRYDATIECARRAIQLQLAYADSHLVLAAALGQLDRPQEARASLDACEQIRPGYLDRRESWSVFKRAKDNEHLLDGLRKAGWKG